MGTVIIVKVKWFGKKNAPLVMSLRVLSGTI